MATPRGWYDVGDGWAGMWDGEQWTGERISHEQLAALTRPAAPPPPYAPPPPAARPGRRPLTKRQLGISIGAAVAVPILLVVALALQPSKLEQAGQAIDKDCSTQAISDKQIQFTANYKSIPCLLTIRAQLEELGFDRGALEDGADRPVRAGRYRLTTAREPIASPVVTITAT